MTSSERASKIITAWNEALTRGDGLCVLDGKVVENLHADEAGRILALHEAIRARLHKRRDIHRHFKSVLTTTGH